MTAPRENPAQVLSRTLREVEPVMAQLRHAVADGYRSVHRLHPHTVDEGARG